MKTLIIKTLLSIAAFYNGNDVETVTITTKNGPVRINKSDYDAKEHTLHKPSKKEVQEQEQKFTKEQINAANPVTPADQPKPSELKVSSEVQSRRVVSNGEAGKKERWYVVNSNNTRVDEDVDYKSEKEAWDAALSQALPNAAEAQNKG